MEKVRLGDVCTINGGYAFKSDQFSTEGVPVIRIGNITKEGLIIDEYVCYDENFWNENDSYRIAKNDILIAMSGATVGKSCINNTERKLLLNQRVAAINCNNNICLKYIFYSIDSEYFAKYIETNSIGCAQPNISIKQISNFEIPVVCEEEQKRIADELDKVTFLIDKRKEQLKKLDELVKARFVELFGFPVSNSKKWDTEKMNDIAPAVNYSGDFEETVWLLNLDMVEAQTGRIIDYLYVSEGEVGNSTCTFDTSNVLYSKLRPYLNKVVTPDRCGYATSEMIPLKPNPLKIERTYLAFMLRSDEFVNMINEKVAGAKMPRVSMGDFRDFDVPVPPMELQKRFTAFVEQTDKSKLEAQKSLEKLELFKKALMQKYFG